MTTTTIRKLVVTSLVTGIVQADGLLESLPLPLWAVQFVRVGIELAFLGSSSALIYEMGAYGWRLATKPRAKVIPPAAPVPASEPASAPDATTTTIARVLGGRIVELEARLAELVGPAKAAEVSPPAPAAEPAATPAPSQASTPSAPKAIGQRIQPGSASFADVLAEVAQ